MTGKNVKRGELLWNFLFSYALCLLCLLLWPSWLTGLVIRLMGTTSSASRYSQIILVPIAIIGYDFLTITAPAEYRYVIGGLPMLLLGLMLLYYRFGKGGSMDDAPAPSEIKKVSKKSLKHQAKKNKVK